MTVHSHRDKARVLRRVVEAVAVALSTTWPEDAVQDGVGKEWVPLQRQIRAFSARCWRTLEDTGLAIRSGIQLRVKRSLLLASCLTSEGSQCRGDFGPRGRISDGIWCSA